MKGLINDLKEIHDHKIELLETLCKSEVNKLIESPSLLPIVTLVNWVKSDLVTVAIMTNTLLEISTRLCRDVKRRRCQSENEAMR